MAQITDLQVTDLILKKRESLALAEAEVKKLRNQIHTLEEMADGNDFAQYLEEKKAKSAPVATPAVAHTKTAFRNYFEKPEKTSVTPKGRNPKGLIRQVVLGVLEDRQERDLDFIESEMLEKLPSPIARSALRAFLMKLRNAGIVTSRKAGLFQLAQKG